MEDRIEPVRAPRAEKQLSSRACIVPTHRERSLLALQANIAAGLKSAARELAPTWDPNHQVSVDNHDVPPVWKTAHSEHHNTTLCSSVLSCVTMKSPESVTLTSQ